MRSREAQEPDSSDFGCGLLRIIANLRQRSSDERSKYLLCNYGLPGTGVAVRIANAGGLMSEEVRKKQRTLTESRLHFALPHVDGFRHWLESQGYTAGTINGLI